MLGRLAMIVAREPGLSAAESEVMFRFGCECGQEFS